MKKLYHFFLTILCLSFAFLITSTDVCAANATPVGINLDGNPIPSAITEDPSSRERTYPQYQFAVGTAGIASFSVINGIEDSSLQMYLYSADNTDSYLNNTYISSKSTKNNIEYTLNPGTYIIRFTSYDPGTFTFSGKFQAFPVNEAEPNNTYIEPMDLPAKTVVTGIVTDELDENDWYRINVATDVRIRITCVSYGEVNVAVKDSAFSDLLSQKSQVVNGTLASPTSSPIEFTAPAGISYIQVSRSYSGSSLYQLSWDIKPVLVTGIQFPGNVTTVAGNKITFNPTILPANATNKTLVYTSTNPTVVSVAADGTIKAVGPGYCAITANTTDGSTAVGTTYVIVKPKKTTGVKAKVKKKTMTISFGTQKNLSAYQIQYCKKKSFKGAKSVNVNFKAKSKAIKSMKKGTWYVRVRAKAYIQGKLYNGDWSKAIKVKIKK